MNVAHVEVNEWDKDGTIVKVTNVTFDDGSKAPGYDLPSLPEVGKPLPEGWEVAQSKAGKPYIKVPKPRGGGGFGGGPAAFRNTEAGFRAEQDWMNRRTAVMQATFEGQFRSSQADEIYRWLTKTPPVAPQTSSDGGKNGGSTPSSERTGEDTSPEAGSQEGEPASGTCPPHVWTPLRPDGNALPKGFVRCTECGETTKEGT